MADVSGNTLLMAAIQAVNDAIRELDQRPRHPDEESDPRVESDAS